MFVFFFFEINVPPIYTGYGGAFLLFLISFPAIFVYSLKNLLASPVLLSSSAATASSSASTASPALLSSSASTPRPSLEDFLCSFHRLHFSLYRG